MPSGTAVGELIHADDLDRFGPFFIEPVVAGLPTPTELEPHPKPFISTMDT